MDGGDIVPACAPAYKRAITASTWRLFADAALASIGRSRSRRADEPADRLIDAVVRAVGRKSAALSTFNSGRTQVQAKSHFYPAAFLSR
jgi:hypothetical protein